MRKVTVLLAALILAAASSHAATMGMNPAGPNLFTSSNASIWGGGKVNNHGSAMCYDCHGTAPKSIAAGTHFVTMSAAVQTNSGGSGIDSNNAATVRNGGEYFGLRDWSTIDSDGNATTQPGGRYTKYYDSAAGVSKIIANTNNPVATTEAAPANFADFELICESCHNIIVNDAGGNLLGATQVNYTLGAESTVCVGCHGFMYTVNGANAAAPANGNYADPRNTSLATAALRDNNEYHWVWNSATGVQEPFKQNHHVMTDDNIDNTRANQRLLWTDNEIVSYVRNPFANNVSTGSTYPALVSTWTVPQQAAGPNMNCTNCHTPGHLGDITEGASILRDDGAPGALAGGGATPTDRIANNTPAFERGGFKNFNDAVYCNQCH